MKKGIMVALLAAVGLGGCVAVPYDAGYGGGYGGGYGYYGPPAVAYPSVSLGVGVSSGPRYYGGHRHYRRW
jgi:hypothetical protein